MYQKMPKIDLFELKREIFHILVGIGVIIISLFIPYSNYFLFIILIFGALLSFFSSQYRIPIVSDFLCMFERGCNLKFPGKGVLFFFTGSLLSLQLFERNIALASIAILTFADPVSHFIGSNFGRTKTNINHKKNIEGTLSGILSGTLFASFLINPFLAFIGSAAAMFFELLGIKMGKEEIDDNLLIPIVAGTAIFLIAKFLIYSIA